MKATEVYVLLFFHLFCMFKIFFTKKLRGCPSPDGWIKHVCSLRTVKYPSAVKRDEVLSSTWMHLENIMPLKDARHRTRHVM